MVRLPWDIGGSHKNTKQEVDKVGKRGLCNMRKKWNERPNVIRSRNGAPSRKGCVANSQMIKASNKLIRPPPTVPALYGCKDQ